MNTLQKVLLGAALVLGLAGLVVGLSDSAQIVNTAGNATNNLGAIASSWTNFAGSGVATKKGFGITDTQDSTTTVIIASVPSPLNASVSSSSLQYGVDEMTTAGSALAVDAITASTTLGANFQCQYSIIEETTSTGAITLTLPPAASSTQSGCLPATGSYVIQKIYLAPGNSYNITLATSTGDTLFYNATSTAGGATLSTSSAGSFYSLESWTLNNSGATSTAAVLYLLGYNGTGH